MERTRDGTQLLKAMAGKGGQFDSYEHLNVLRSECKCWAIIPGAFNYSSLALLNGALVISWIKATKNGIASLGFCVFAPLSLLLLCISKELPLEGECLFWITRRDGKAIMGWKASSRLPASSWLTALFLPVSVPEGFPNRNSVSKWACGSVKQPDRRAGETQTYPGGSRQRCQPTPCVD